MKRGTITIEFEWDPHLWRYDELKRTVYSYIEKNVEPYLLDGLECPMMEYEIDIE